MGKEASRHHRTGQRDAGRDGEAARLQEIALHVDHQQHGAAGVERNGIGTGVQDGHGSSEAKAPGTPICNSHT